MSAVATVPVQPAPAAHAAPAPRAGTQAATPFASLLDALPHAGTKDGRANPAKTAEDQGQSKTRRSAAETRAALESALSLALPQAIVAAPAADVPPSQKAEAPVANPPGGAEASHDRCGRDERARRRRQARRRARISRRPLPGRGDGGDAIRGSGSEPRKSSVVRSRAPTGRRRQSGVASAAGRGAAQAEPAASPFASPRGLAPVDAARAAGRDAALGESGPAPRSPDRRPRNPRKRRKPSRLAALPPPA